MVVLSHGYSVAWLFCCMVVLLHGRIVAWAFSRSASCSTEMENHCIGETYQWERSSLEAAEMSIFWRVLQEIWPRGVDG
jgi:hypothetical protein